MVSVSLPAQSLLLARNCGKLLWWNYWRMIVIGDSYESVKYCKILSFLQNSFLSAF